MPVIWDREVTVVYTAAGEINGGSLKLTVPAGWSHPTMDNVEITTTGSVNRSSALYGGAYVGDPDDTTDDDFPEDADEVALLGAMDVTVDGVNLDAGETVTFVYSAAMVQPTTGDASFGVAVDGGAGPGEGSCRCYPRSSRRYVKSVSEMRHPAPVRVYGRPSRLSQSIRGNTLTFIYTPAGQIDGSVARFRVEFPPVGQSRPTGLTPLRRAVSPLRIRSLMVKSLNCKQPLRQLSKNRSV